MAKPEVRRGSRVASSGATRAAPPVAATDRVRAAESERQSLAAILNLVRKGGATTRLDIERDARLGRAVVADRLATLEGFGLIDNRAVGRSVGGRAPRLVRFRAEAGRLLVANIDRDTIGVGLADLEGQLVLEHYEDIDVGMSAEALFRRVDALFTWSLDQDGAAGLWGISLGLPGPVTSHGNGGIELPDVGAIPDWHDARLVERLADRFAAPLWARSAVQVATMGEIGALTHAQNRDMLFVDLGTEINAGFLSNGRLHRGAHGIAGGIGHVYVADAQTAICGCGNVGCLQAVAGCEAVAREGLRAATDGRSRVLAETLRKTGVVTVADVGTATRFGDPFSADLLARTGRSIGTVLATLVNVLNPSIVVIGGELAQTGDICIAAIREGIYRHSQPLLTRDLAIVRSRTGRSSGLIGAAEVALDALFAPDILEGWITSGSPLAHPDVLRLLEDARRAVQA
ncbi:ROK family protein [Lichenifustis flavocetrariae]|uniref:ROK family protein n=1 Tax=Lichenifustis flavocetrariae TaxID=2949735 RepID=A0AA41YXE7_9HYPH|nr:ROK family protein [Lichenifustis flavocetrariae]MCW6508773.1 ROK family protein [Lichenifustis flavocetrariae]